MYATCLFCERSLGTNAAVEHFPVGRRLAFDAAKGRLWAVCRACGRWNLSPLDERWEAIEECERLFEGTRLRASTDEIGLARIAEGTELVRIGAPQRPEFAAWRYGDQFGKRRQRMILRVGAGVAVLGVVVATHGFGLLAAGSFPYASWQLPNQIIKARRQRRVVARGTDESGRAFVMRGKHLGRAVLLGAPGDVRLHFAHDGGESIVSGSEAMRVSGLVLARLNANGAGRSDVQDAVARLERAGGPEALLGREARSAVPAPVAARRRGRWSGGAPTKLDGGLEASDPLTRLALEMAVNEENERRAMQGELAELAAAWQEADEIAAISDDMFLPESVDARLAALKADAAQRTGTSHGDPRRLIVPPNDRPPNDRPPNDGGAR